ncbi:MAG: hypothetical protein IKR86_11535 [Candidatus Methanomethylophilaceae archaeon]|nr:hypothetical protein [Candidatus Methanomethylophilaceae archaeon]
MKSIPDIDKKMWILEEKVLSHPEIGKIFPYSANTIRITTVRDGQHIKILHHWMKFGTGNNYIDNAHHGGICIAVDGQGCLYDDAFQYSTGKHYKRHPDTNYEFNGFQIPYWDQTKRLVLKAHELLYDMQSIGWDVAISPYGPVLVEGNTYWGMSEALQLAPDTWDNLYEQYIHYYS